MKLVIGLGNIGKNYQKNRHNIGFMALDSFAKSQDVDFKTDTKMQAEICKVGGILIAKPTTMMNSSGQAVRAITDYYKIESEDVLIVYDEIDLPFETIRVRGEGGSGGHNGIKSIIAHLNTDQFKRIRIGIRNEKTDKKSASKFVLSNFSRKEAKQIDKILAKTDELIAAFIKFDELPEETYKIN